MKKLFKQYPNGFTYDEFLNVLDPFFKKQQVLTIE